MFKDLKNLTNINYLTKCDTSRMTSMYEMFYNCRSLTSLDLSKFNTSKVKDMS